MRSNRLNKCERLCIRVFAALLMIMLCASAVPLIGGSSTVSAATVTALGKVNTDKANLRESPTTKSQSLAELAVNTEVTVNCEVYTGNLITTDKNVWYQVSVGGQSGYIRSDLVTVTGYSNISGALKAEFEYRKGPGDGYKSLGTAMAGSAVTIFVTAIKEGSNEVWYHAAVNGVAAYVNAAQVEIGAASPAETAPKEDPALEGKSPLARALLTNPTDGGSARIVYTFNSSNCKKKFRVKGYKNNHVPQGMTYNGGQYYILFGMYDRQGIVTYSSMGFKLKTSKFPYNMGHPNGITWDPITGLCYIFKGNQKRIYTWNPATNQFGKAATPFSSSGVAYDPTSNVLYATSQSGIRLYSAEGAFQHQRLFARCTHPGKTYIQDCGAGAGFIFHGVSGSNKHTINYLDVYRVADSKYLGTIKVTLGELESAVVAEDGTVELLINHAGTYDEYIWRTPLNVNELL